MSPNISDETDLSSYKFYDSNNYVIVSFYANGAVEQKDFDVCPNTDSLEVSTPAGEKWMFQLYEHVYPDETEMKTEINETRTQTLLEIRLYKQQKHTLWPQLYSLQSIPITPQRNNNLNETANTELIHSTIEQEQEPFELSIKRLEYDFLETEYHTVLISFFISQVSRCDVQFSETNFTAIFQTNDEQFLQNHLIPANRPIKLFVRVKERIKPDECDSYKMPNCIEIVLVKENQSGIRWNRLEPNEYYDRRETTRQLGASIDPLSIMNSTVMFDSSMNSRTFTNSVNHSRLIPTSYQTENSYMPSMTSSLAVAKSVVGYTGIYNPANSCFMNAALQCLSNTRELRDYFLKSYYKSEINRVNPLGMEGVMAEEFGKIIQELWSGNYSYIIANQLRDYAAKRHQEFIGNGQHDAQELLTILLDAIHEDLNRVINKPLVPPIEDENRADEIVADEYWRGYLSRNDSIIVQLFTGQFKSKTKCPQCHKESVTFDPFTSLSVPLPKNVSIDVIVFFRNTNKPPTKYRIIMSSDGSIGDLKRRVSGKCGLPIAKMLAYKMPNNHSIDIYKDGDRITASNYSWNAFDITYITEILTNSECNNEPIIQLVFLQRVFKVSDYVSSCGYCQASPKPDRSPTFCSTCYRVAYCDEDCLRFHKSDHIDFCHFRQSDNYEFIGLPFIISLPESKVTWTNIVQEINIRVKHTVDICITHSTKSRQSYMYNDGYSDVDDNDDDDDNFSDIENTDWETIKTRLSTSDSWSIVRIGDYIVKKSQNKQNSKQKKNATENILTNNHNYNVDYDGEDERMITGNDNSGNIDDFDMVDDIHTSQSLFRLMPQPLTTEFHNLQPIVEPDDDTDNILRSHNIFSIDWFTDNKHSAAFRVTSSTHRSGINDLVEDDSVFNALNKEQDITLEQCLNLFIEPEVLGPDDKWYCPHCKEHIQAEKKMSVWRLPPILIIHLKRFKYDQHSSFGYMSSSREKIDTTVKFPIFDLNMTPYCSSVSETNVEHDNLSQYRYDLYGIINHRGTAWFGHYTSYARLLAFNDPAKSEIGWRLFDDQCVSSLSNVKDLIRSDAYVLFYRHRSLPVQFNLKEQLQSTLSDSIVS